jgi:gamma-aminobutyric acid receptor subunit beta
MLTHIAYRFILGNQLPRVSYFTLLDYFILGSTVLVFMALLEVVITSGLAQAGKTAQAHRLQRAARLVFPLLFCLLIVAVFTSQLHLPNPSTR